MASPGEIAQVIAVFSSIRTTQLVLFGPLTFIVYDSLITFEREVRLFWTRKFTVASALFFTIRYVGILRAGLSFAVASQNLLDERYQLCPSSASASIDGARFVCSCSELTKAAQFLADASFLPFAVFSAVRAHALTRSKIIATIIFVLSLAPLVVNFVQYGQGVTGVVDPVVGCQTLLLQVTSAELIMFVVIALHHTSLEMLTQWNRFPIVSRVGLVLSDLILVLATWRTLAVGPGRPQFAHRAAGSIAGVMWWNGLVYFIILTILNLLHLVFRIVLAFAFGDQAPTEPLTLITAFTDPLTVVLVSRFLLDLQDASRQDMKLDSDNPLHFGVSLDGTPSFVRAVGVEAAPAEADSKSERGTESDYSDQETLPVAEHGIEGEREGTWTKGGTVGSFDPTSFASGSRTSLDEVVHAV
ncbi:hypothetical protein C8T65DRAFT_744339 [Cerioporus squamosus]|nr:hypothetical protein C8T65DRAFT_744339 [Cerioporus squamosus]